MAVPMIGRGDASAMMETEVVERENGSQRQPYSEIDVLHEQLDVFVRDGAGHREWAAEAKTDVEYIENKQWSDEDKMVLASQGRPALTFNKIAPLFNLLIGFYRQNRSEVRYLPGHDGAATQEIADTLTHVGKQVQELEQYKWKEAEVFQDGIASGRGFFDVRVEWEQNMLGQIIIAPRDPFATYMDCDADAYDIAEHKRITYNAYASIEEIALKYGGEKAMALYNNRRGTALQIESHLSDINVQDEISPDRFFGLRDYLRDEPTRFTYLGQVPGTGVYDHVDRQRRLIRVLDRQHKKLKQCRYFVDAMTGDKVVIPDTWNDQKIGEVVQAVAQQAGQLVVMDGYREAWRWTVTAADVVLHDDWSPYETPTIIGYFPYFRRGVTHSFARNLRDAQDEVNKRRSALIHTIMTQANSGWLVEEGSIEPEMRDGLEDNGSRPGIIVDYRRGSTAPQRIQPAAPPASLKMLEESAARDLKEIAGINDSALGQVDRVQSGRAIEARQRQAIVSHERAFDNMARTRELFGRKQLQLVQQWYTTERLIRVRGEGNTQDMVKQINQRTANGQIINDVMLGRYSVVIDESPATATMQQTQFDELIEMVKMGLLGPEMADIIIDASSAPRKEEIKQRLLMVNQAAQAQAQMRAQGIGGGMPMGPGPGGAPMGGPPGPGGPMSGGPGGGMPPGGPPGSAMPNQPMPPPGSPMPPQRPAVAPNPAAMVGPMGAPMPRPAPR